jgi:hypothetical protein
MADEQVVWVAYYPDHPAIRVFVEEIDCLRFAVANGMTVKAIKSGERV